MKHASLTLATLWLLAALPALAQDAPPEHGVQLQAITELPASYPRDVPVPQGLKPVAAGERDGGMIVLFRGVGKAQPLREAYQAALPKRGWTIEGTDEVGDEQGLFAVQCERTLSIFFYEKGPELRVQLAHVSKTPQTHSPAPK